MKKILLILSLSIISLKAYNQIDYTNHSRLSILFESSPRQDLKTNTQLGILTKYYGNYVGLRTYHNDKNSYLSITFMGRIPLTEEDFLTINPFYNITFDKETSYGMKFFVQPYRLVSIGASFSSKEVGLSFMLNFDVEGQKHYLGIKRKR